MQISIILIMKSASNVTMIHASITMTKISRVSVYENIFMQQRIKKYIYKSEKKQSKQTQLKFQKQCNKSKIQQQSYLLMILLLIQIYQNIQQSSKKNIIILYIYIRMNYIKEWQLSTIFEFKNPRNTFIFIFIVNVFLIQQCYLKQEIVYLFTNFIYFMLLSIWGFSKIRNHFYNQEESTKITLNENVINYIANTLVEFKNGWFEQFKLQNNYVQINYVMKTTLLLLLGQLISSHFSIQFVMWFGFNILVVLLWIAETHQKKVREIVYYPYELILSLFDMIPRYTGPI